MTIIDFLTKSSIKVDVVPDFFDYSNFILTLITVILSLLAIWRTIKESRTSFEIGIINMVQEAKINMDNNIAQLHKEDDEQERMLSLRTYIENYLNALDAACAMYLSKDVKRRRFRVLFLEDIKNLYNSEFFHSLIYKNPKSYQHIKKFIVKNKINNIKK